MTAPAVVSAICTDHFNWGNPKWLSRGGHVIAIRNNIFQRHPRALVDRVRKRLEVFQNVISERLRALSTSARGSLREFVFRMAITWPPRDSHLGISRRRSGDSTRSAPRPVLSSSTFDERHAGTRAMHDGKSSTLF